MKKLIGCALMPYSDLIIKQINNSEPEQIKDTIESIDLAAKLIVEKRPDTIVILSSSEYALKDTIAISVHPRLKGSFRDEELSEIALGFETDSFLVDVIVQTSFRLG
ncbi:extradiol ring-cleavage dioxygenase, partial [Selenomonadales bacterium OttesenSCG-928-I06]|nr:extradiol ring-cleavage dioxygenase [Selenomonadales bacterium OttesenSCG-928-I06]